MTNTELIQAIKAEIERHLNSATEHQNANPDMPKYRWYLYEGEKELCTDLLGYIDDSLESEKPMQDGLDEEIREYMSNKDNNPFDWYWWDKRDCARHFAKWGADHTPLPEDTVLFNKGVAEGKRLMMKEAVEGQVFGATDVKALYEGKVYVVSNLVQDTDYNLHPNDKVRVIICKKED